MDSDRTPGFNSEGGIAVVINVHDDFADVTCVAIPAYKDFQMFTIDRSIFATDIS